MRIVLLFTLAGLFLASCNNKPSANANDALAGDSTFTITGSISGIDTGKVIFVHRPVDNKVYDTVDVKKGAFQFAGKVPSTDGMVAYTCFIDGKDDNRLEILVENAKINVTAKADSFDQAVISGSGSQDVFNAFKKQTADIDNSMAIIAKTYDLTKDRDTLDHLDRLYDRYDSIKQTYVPGFVKEHSNSIASAYIISRVVLIRPRLTSVETVYLSLDSSVRETKLGKTIASVIEAIKKTEVGQIAPDFTMSDRDGKPVALSSLRGKYIFLDFWASWCGPCRKENPNIVEAYSKFHSPKFDILGVSLDTKKDKWEEAIAKDKLTWNHVSDLKGWGNEAGKIYGIRSIPANLLLNKEGKILARNLYGNDLDKKLAEVLK
jgi:peroxiredoxin